MPEVLIDVMAKKQKKAGNIVLLKSLLPSFLLFVHTNTALSYVPPVVHVASLSKNE